MKKRQLLGVLMCVLLLFTSCAFAESTDSIHITLSDDGITYDSQTGFTCEGSVVTITAAGTYTFTGKLSNGQIVIDAPKNDKVELVFSGVDITCLTSAPLYVKCADEVEVTCEKDTDNVLTDNLSGHVDEDVNACIYSKDDLTLKGKGTLTVNGTVEEGIRCSNDITVKNLTLTVNAIDDGIHGKDSVTVESGRIAVIAGKDALKASADDRTDKGYVSLLGGEIVLTCGDDGIQSITAVTISDCAVVISAGDKNYTTDGQTNVDESCVVVMSK